MKVFTGQSQALNSAAMRTPKRLFLDGTHTHRSGLGHGVQRVVRKLSAHLPAAAGAALEFQPVTMCGQGFTVTPLHRKPNSGGSGRLNWKSNEIRANVLNYAPEWYLRAAKAVCARTNSRKLRKWLLPAPYHCGIFKLPINVLAAWEKRQARATQPTFLPGEGDILVLPDAYWSQLDIWPVVARAREQGAYIVSLVHDLIPLTHPQFVDDAARQVFFEYVKQFATNSDLIVTVSSTVRDSLRESLPRLLPDLPICEDIRASRNGAELGTVSGSVRKEIKQIFVDQKNAPFLMVSSFDPRKNHKYLLDAFDQLWQQGGDQKLCLVGGTGPHCRDVLERIASHRLHQSQLFAIHDASDAELSYCYEKCRAALFTSIVEGFGLPIAEAQWYGKTVFASDTPIHREVGRHGCHYCDLNDAGNLAQQVADWHRKVGPNPPPEQIPVKPSTWQESSELLLQNCLAGYSDWKYAKHSQRAAA